MALWLLKPTTVDDGLALFPQKLNFEHQMLNSEVYLQFGERGEGRGRNHNFAPRRDVGEAKMLYHHRSKRGRGTILRIICIKWRVDKCKVVLCLQLFLKCWRIFTVQVAPYKHVACMVLDDIFVLRCVSGGGLNPLRFIVGLRPQPSHPCTPPPEVKRFCGPG